MAGLEYGLERHADACSHGVEQAAVAERGVAPGQRVALQVGQAQTLTPLPLSPRRGAQQQGRRASIARFVI
jgi:hypothetical protein